MEQIQEQLHVEYRVRRTPAKHNANLVLGGSWLMKVSLDTISAEPNSLFTSVH
jgi:hypothetical protein